MIGDIETSEKRNGMGSWNQVNPLRSIRDVGILLRENRKAKCGHEITLADKVKENLKIF